MPDHRDEFAVAACLDPQNAETVLVIVVGDALDEARQHFLGRWFRLRLHANCRVICFAAARPIPRHIEVAGPDADPCLSRSLLDREVAKRILSIRI